MVELGPCRTKWAKWEPRGTSALHSAPPELVDLSEQTVRFPNVVERVNVRY